MLIVSISLRFARLGQRISCSFQESMAETFISFLPFSPQLNMRKSKRSLHLLLLTPWILLKRAVQPSSVIHCRQSWSIWRFSWCFFDCLGLSFSLSPFPNVLFPLFLSQTPMESSACATLWVRRCLAARPPSVEDSPTLSTRKLSSSRLPSSSSLMSP